MKKEFYECLAKGLLQAWVDLVGENKAQIAGRADSFPRSCRSTGEQDDSFFCGDTTSGN